MNRLLVGGIGCSFLGLVVYVVGIATTAWLSVAQSGAEDKVGLWQECVYNPQFGRTICIGTTDISRLPAAFNASRAFTVIGIMLLIPGLALACFTLKKNSNKFKKIGGGMIIAGGVCGIIAAACFTGYAVNLFQTSGVPVPFGYSFYLTWVQAVFTIMGGAIIICSGRRDEEDELPMVR
ncbi:PREDICTED: claudin-11-like [Branchiostoma belcheri]|uniref:Claudin-11-like n=1 Tax=Branchiostoma belcheri TaxID=7741 RepID=A0A6P4ZG28_BRABE|nr:PREDICTED: claudin-11-like [Branchiostoma belcheri]